MYPISDELKKLFLDGNKKCVKLTLNGVSFENDVITEADVLSDSLTVDRYCSSGNKIEVGSAIAAELTLTLLNNDGKFNDITFEGSEVSLEISIDGVGDSYIPCGKFTIDEPPRSLQHIKLRALDFMMLFDRKVNASEIQEIDTIENLLVKCCEVCNVDLWDAVAIKSLPNCDQTIKVPAADITYRQIVQWIAQLTGTCAFMDWDGKLRLSWFKDSGVVLDPTNRYMGGTLDENNITIKGVCIKTQNTVVTTEDSVNPVVIESNQLLYSDDETYLEAIANNIATGIGALTYRPFQCNTIPMPFLYPLDIVSYEMKVEEETVVIPTVITNHNFGLNKASALSAVGETATQSGYSSVKGLTKAEIDSAIREAMKGVDAKAEHIHIKYSQYETGVDINGKAAMTDKPDANTEYLGTCATNSTSPPDTPSSYKWVKIRGADGTNGKDGQDGKDGEDGKGISEVINYYLTTNKADGVTRDDFGGNTEIVTPDKDKPYLWNYEKIRYTSGNPTYTDPCIIGNFAENGSNGRGIKSITEYYLTTQTESKPLKSSFKDTVQTPTETLPFLWNYEKIEYTDDSTPYESDVRLIGVYGSDGKSLFTWVKYADDTSGTNMSDNATGKKYMGIAYNKTSATESTTASDYAWSKIQGDDGRGVSKVETEYRLSTSDTSLSSGYTWGTDAPTWQDGLFLWTRLATTYTDGTTEYSDPVVDASWKKTSVVDEATEELNSALAGALGLHKTELDGTIYYHTNSVLQNSTSLDVIFVLNSSGFGVCKSGWSNENLTFSYGVTTTGQAVWDIITAHKISADLVEAGSIRSLPSAKVQTTINLDDGTISSTNGETSVKIQGGYTDENGVTYPAGIALESETEDRHFVFTPSELSFTTIEYLLALLLHELNPSRNPKPEDPYFSSVAEKDIKTTNLHCKNIYIVGDSDGNEYNLMDALSMLSEQVNLLSESLTTLQEKYLALEEALGQQHEHTASTAVRENVVSATCTSQGSYDNVVYCTTCGKEITDSRETITTDALGHNYTSVVTPPTETAQGYTTHTCSRCGDKYIDSYTDATGCQHSTTGVRYETTKEATCTVAGSRNKITYCTKCSTIIRTVTEAIAATGHTYGAVSVVEPTCTEQGYSKETCLICGYVNKKNYTAATEHNDSNGDGFCDACGVQTGTFYTITVQSNNSNYGSVEGGGTFLKDKIIAIIAGANPGYHFVQWNDGNTSEIRTITVTGNATYIAYFEADAVEELTISAGETKRITVDTNNKGGMDNLTESDYTMLKFVAPETAKYEFKSVTAYNPDSSDTFGALFDSTKANRLVYDDQGGSDGHFLFTYDCEAGKTYYFAVKYWALNRGGDIDVKVTKKSTATTYTVTISVSPSGTGTVTGAGTYANGETAYLTATPNDGYEFDYWLIGSGSTQYKSNPLDLYMNANATVTAVFKVASSSGAKKTITFTNGNSDLKIEHNGTVLKTMTTAHTLYTYEFTTGDKVTLTSTPHSGYDFWRYSDGTNKITSSNPYSFTVSDDTPSEIWAELIS